MALILFSYIVEFSFLIRNRHSGIFLMLSDVFLST